MRKLENYVPTKFKAKDSIYDEEAADFVVAFIEQLKHTKGEFYNQPFELIDWQEQIIRDIFGTLKPDGYRQFTTAYIKYQKSVVSQNLQLLLHFICFVQMESNVQKCMAVLPTETRPRSYLT